MSEFGAFGHKKIGCGIHLIRRRRLFVDMPPRSKSPASSSLFDASPNICKIAAPTTRRICHQQSEKTFSTATIAKGQRLLASSDFLNEPEVRLSEADLVGPSVVSTFLFQQRTTPRAR
jgi:hypothetical protein